AGPAGCWPARGAGGVGGSAARFTLADGGIAPRPSEPVEVWIGAGAAPAIDRAARLGDGWLAGPEIPLAEARTRLQLYRERCRAHGRTPSAVAIRRDVYVAESAGDARAGAGAVPPRRPRPTAPPTPSHAAPRRRSHCTA